jgi:ceramide glucosyltransferase
LPLLLLTNAAPWAIVLSAVTLTVRYLQVLVAVLRMRCPRLLLWLWALPLRDALNLWVWGMGAFGQGVYWRGRQLRVEGDGLITQWE